MPLDGTDLEFIGNHPLAKLGAVESLLATEQQWCKGRLRDRGGRHCLIGAMQAAEAHQILEPIILRAASNWSPYHFRQPHYQPGCRGLALLPRRRPVKGFAVSLSIGVLTSLFRRCW